MARIQSVIKFFVQKVLGRFWRDSTAFFAARRSLHQNGARLWMNVQPFIDPRDTIGLDFLRRQRAELLAFNLEQMRTMNIRRYRLQLILTLAGSLAGFTLLARAADETISANTIDHGPFFSGTIKAKFPGPND